jgi:hypothetical protein
VAAALGKKRRPKRLNWPPTSGISILGEPASGAGERTAGNLGVCETKGVVNMVSTTWLFVVYFFILLVLLSAVAVEVLKIRKAVETCAGRLLSLMTQGESAESRRKAGS